MESVVPESMRWHYDDWHLSPLVKYGGIALIAGVTGSRSDGSCHENIRTEFVDAFEKLGEVLRAGGLDYEHIIEMTTFHVGMANHLDTFREVRDAYLDEPWPAWSAIGTTELAVPGPHVEIKVTCRT